MAIETYSIEINLEAHVVAKDGTKTEVTCTPGPNFNVIIDGAVTVVNPVLQQGV